MGHLRLIVRGEHGVEGVVHVRSRHEATARELMRPVLTVGADTPIYEALQTMRERRSHLAIVADADQLVGLITITDVLERLLPAAGAAA